MIRENIYDLPFETLTLEERDALAVDSGYRDYAEYVACEHNGEKQTDSPQYQRYLARQRKSLKR